MLENYMDLSLTNQETYVGRRTSAVILDGSFFTSVNDMNHVNTENQLMKPSRTLLLLILDELLIAIRKGRETRAAMDGGAPVRCPACIRSTVIGR